MRSLGEQVARVLESDAAQRMNFRCGQTRVDGRAYLAVARALRRRSGAQHQIQCEYNTNLEVAGCGNYDEAFGVNAVNIMKLPFRSLDNVRQGAVAVHEATHAVQDYHQVPMTQLDAECAAYVARMLFVKISDPDTFPYANDTLGTASLSPNALMIFADAYQIASRIYSEPAYDVTPGEIDGLKTDLREIPFYRGRGNRSVQYDGI